MPEGPGVKTISDKEKAWKEHQRKQGVKEKDLKPLEPAQKKSNRVPRKTVDPSQFPRKDISKPSAEFMSYDPGDVSRVEQLNREGRGLLDSIKVSECIPSVFVVCMLKAGLYNNNYDASIKTLVL